jgi:hypothetical protein
MKLLAAALVSFCVGCSQHPVVPPGSGLAVPLTVEKQTRVIDQPMPPGRYEVRLDRERKLMTADGRQVIAGCTGPRSAARKVDYPTAELRGDENSMLVVLLPDGTEWLLAKQCDLL